MALVDLEGHVYFPELARYSSTQDTGSMTAAGNYIYAVFQITEATSITHMCFMVGDGGSALNRFTAGLETVDAATGGPSGTAYAGSAPSAEAALSSYAVNDVQLGTATSAGSMAVGDVVAFVVRCTQYTSDAKLRMQYSDMTTSNNPGFPYWGTYVGASPALSVANSYSSPMFGLRGAGGAHKILGVEPPLTTATYTVENDSATTDAVGNVFVAPFSARVVGAWFHADLDNDATVILYNSGTTVLASKALDKDIRGTTGSNTFRVIFTAPYDIVAGTTYRIALRADSASAFSFYSKKAADADYYNGVKGFNMFLASSLNGTTWTDSATDVAYIGLIISQIDVSAGGGGGGSHIIGSGVIKALDL